MNHNPQKPTEPIHLRDAVMKAVMYIIQNNELSDIEVFIKNRIYTKISESQDLVMITSASKILFSIPLSEFSKYIFFEAYSSQSYKARYFITVVNEILCSYAGCC